MVVGGFQKFSLVDYPGKISAIVFTQGCNFRCHYCHNPELVDPQRYATPISEDFITSFLNKRMRRLQGVVISGGEPTVHADLPFFIEKLRSLGYSVKLDTNGSNPQMLEKIIQDRLVDSISMDIKAPLPSYARIAGVSVRTEDIERSIHLIMESRLLSDFRTTYLDSLLSIEDMKSIGEMVMGCSNFTLQRFVSTKALQREVLSQPSPSTEKLADIQALLLAMGVPCRLL